MLREHLLTFIHDHTKNIIVYAIFYVDSEFYVTPTHTFTHTPHDWPVALVLIFARDQHAFLIHVMRVLLLLLQTLLECTAAKFIQVIHVCFKIVPNSISLIITCI